MRRFRGVEYKITIKNNRSGDYRLTVDVQVVEGKIIPWRDTEKTVEVICET